MVVKKIPDDLMRRPFTRAEAIAAGVSPRMLQGRRFVRIHPAVYRHVDHVMSHADAIEAARLHGAADVVVPTLDTIVEERDGFIVGIPERTQLRNGQAPQAFRYEVLMHAHEVARRSGTTGATDDAQLVEAAGHPCVVVDGSPHNLKITTAPDLAIASAILKAGGSKPHEQPNRSPFVDEREMW